MLWTRANELLACVEDALEAQGRPWTGEQPYVSASSQLIADHCCPGQLSARIGRSHPYDIFPAKSLELANCGKSFASAIIVSILRCPSGLDRLQQGRPPTPAQQNADAENMVCDMAALVTAAECCLDGDYVFDQVAPITQMGDCYGVEMVVWVDAGPTCETEG